MKFQLFISLVLAASSLALVAPRSAEDDLSIRAPQALPHATAVTARYQSPRDQGQCQNQKKVDECEARGPEWWCDEDCKCQGPAGQCHDDNKWKICLGEGKHADDKCQCKCPRKDEDACEGGYLDGTCHCIKPTYKWRRSALTSSEMCNAGRTACLISGGSAKRYECLDITSTLDSCGGCTSEGQGTDCTALEGASDVQCVDGKCLISSCEKGWLLAFNGTTCILKGESSGSVLSGALKGAEKVMGW